MYTVMNVENIPQGPDVAVRLNRNIAEETE
jgi:hypothetical protein